MKTTLIAVLLSSLLTSGCNTGPSYTELSELARVERETLVRDIAQTDDFIGKYRYCLAYEGSKDPEKLRIYNETSKAIDSALNSVQLQREILEIAEERRDAAKP